MNRRTRRMLSILLALIVLICTGCMTEDGTGRNSGKTASKVPQIPEKLSKNTDGIPELKVYNTATDGVEEMDIESYIMGVVAGEMKNDWPIEALKAQAILARTFTMKFVSSKESGYSGADISTDVNEAQAYDSESINDRIREAVNDTQGLVMIADGEFPYAWFHAHSGGKTELPGKALEYKEDPSYLSVVDSRESDKAPDDVKHWTAEFTLEEAQQACADAGTDVGTIESFKIGETGKSGRAVTFKVNGKEISAPGFRIRIGADKLKSTLIDSIRVADGKVVFSGSGFGHGVGMSQWGAYQMADEGGTAEEIIKHYYTGVNLVELW